MGATVTGCSSLIAGIAGAGNRPRASLATAGSMDDEVVDMVIPANTATSAALATRAISVPRIPTTSLAPRPAHRRAPGACPDCGAGAERSSPSCASPVMGMIGWSVRAAAGGCELVTGWKRSLTCRVRGEVGGFEQLTKTRSRALKSVHGADPCRTGPGPSAHWFGITAFLTSLAGPPATGAHQLLSVSGRLRYSHTHRSVGPCRYAGGTNTSSKSGTTRAARYERGLQGRCQWAGGSTGAWRCCLGRVA
jgi:hypothetical protein